MSLEVINDFILVGMIKVLEIIKEAKEEGDDLNTIDFNYLIEHRKRDMINPELLKEVQRHNNKDLI
jgi:hypothetical protein